MADDEPIDTLVLIGDAVALFAYGAVQGIVDLLLSPIASENPDMFTNADLPLESPLAQGSLLALVWVGLAQLSGSYSVSRTRQLPDTLLTAAVTWIASSATLIGALALLASTGLGPGATPAETDFIVGSATVVGGWRLVTATALP